MDFAVVTDTGLADAVRELSAELDEHAPAFAAATAAVPGELLLCLRCLPDEIGRRTFSRYDRANRTVGVDLTVSKERFAGKTVAWQREELGSVVWERLVHVIATTKAPWSKADRATIHDATHTLLTAARWLDGPRAQACALLARELPIDQVAEWVGLDTGEVEEIYIESLTQPG